MLKTFIFSLLFSVLVSPVFAQQVQIKEDMNDKEYSTIEVRKKHQITKDLEYKIEDGKESIDGEASLLAKDAKTSWKQACNDWKKEFRENNVGNKVISINCGSMKCETQNMETTCRSEGSYKVRVKLTTGE